jgi:NAD(P)H dehydrogenase (quinone)
MIIVTGAAGVLGRGVLERLLDLVPAERVGASVRDPAAARDLAERGVRVRRGDYAEPETLADAFEGAEQVLLISANRLGDEAIALHRTAIGGAVAAGAGRILYTSHQGARPDSPFAPGPNHAATEDLLAAAGTAWTSLRNGFYTNTISRLLGDVADTGELRLPADGPVAWTTREDLAAAAARLLVDGAPDGPTRPLTGPGTVDMDGVAAITGELLGRPVRRVVVSDDEYVADQVRQGVPEVAGRMMVGMFDASRRGDFAPADPALAELIGRPATSVRQYLESALHPAR